MKTVIKFDRDEEQRLLEAWFDTVSFDEKSDGVPDIQDDEGEDPDETKAGFDTEVKVRHVRTPAGQRRFGQPIGSIIVRDRPLANLKLTKPGFADWTRVRDSKGNEYDLGHDDEAGKWIATRAGDDWDAVVVTANTEDELYSKLDTHVGGGGKRTLPKKAPAKAPAKPAPAPAKPATGKGTHAVGDRVRITTGPDGSPLPKVRQRTGVVDQVGRANAENNPMVRVQFDDGTSSRVRASQVAKHTDKPASSGPKPLEDMSLSELRDVARQELSTGTRFNSRTTRASLIQVISDTRARRAAAAKKTTPARRTEPSRIPAPKPVQYTSATGKPISVGNHVLIGESNRGQYGRTSWEVVKLWPDGTVGLLSTYRTSGRPTRTRNSVDPSTLRHAGDESPKISAPAKVTPPKLTPKKPSPSTAQDRAQAMTERRTTPTISNARRDELRQSPSAVMRSLVAEGDRRRAAEAANRLRPKGSNPNSDVAQSAERRSNAELDAARRANMQATEDDARRAEMARIMAGPTAEQSNAQALAVATQEAGLIRSAANGAVLDPNIAQSLSTIANNYERGLMTREDTMGMLAGLHNYAKESRDKRRIESLIEKLDSGSKPAAPKGTVRVTPRMREQARSLISQSTLSLFSSGYSQVNLDRLSVLQIRLVDGRITPSEAAAEIEKLAKRVKGSYTIRGRLTQTARELRDLEKGTKSSGLILQLKDLRDALVKADGETQTGAMIALIPREEDLYRLYDPMGEDMDELHVTLAYLGKAADISTNAQFDIIRRMTEIAGRTSAAYGRAFSVNIFNPTGEEPCVVLGIGANGHGMPDVHHAVNMALGDSQANANWQMPDNHLPWIPHITLRYFKGGEPIDMDWVQKQFDKLGDVVFDRIRIAFAGNIIDLPIETAETTMGPNAPAPSAYEKGVVITPGGRVGNDRRLGSRTNRTNWVERTPAGELPWYIRVVRNGLMKQGHSESRATALAKAAIERWASGRGNVTPKVRAAAAAALAEWEAMRASRSAKAAPTGGSATGGYLDARMAQGGTIADNSRASNRAHNPRFEELHPRKGGRFASKPGSGSSSNRRDNAGSLSDALKKVLPLKYGAQGKVIEQLQILLDKFGFQTEQDGIYGDKTVAAVKAAQKRFGFDPTGEVDENLMQALLNASRPKPKTRKRRR